MRPMTPISQTPAGSLPSANADNIQRLDYAVRASSPRKFNAEQTPWQGRTLSAATSIHNVGFFGGVENKLYPTDSVIIASFNPVISRRTRADFFYRHVEGPLAEIIANIRVIDSDETRSFPGIINKLIEQKQRNGGQPLSRISIVSHGSEGKLKLGDGSHQTVSQVVQQLMKKGLLQAGGSLVLCGCDIAGSPQAREQLSALAQKHNIRIQASEGETQFGSENLYHLTFYPTGRVTRSSPS
jgi:Domain of unknown function (DUF4347)